MFWPIAVIHTLSRTNYKWMMTVFVFFLLFFPPRSLSLQFNSGHVWQSKPMEVWTEWVSAYLAGVSCDSAKMQRADKWISFPAQDVGAVFWYLGMRAVVPLSVLRLKVNIWVWFSGEAWPSEPYSSKNVTSWRFCLKICPSTKTFLCYGRQTKKDYDAV